MDGEGVRVNLAPTRITELNRAGIHGKIPGRVASGDACLSCGLQAASDMLAAASEAADASVILVTGDEESTHEINMAADMNIYTIGYASLKMKKSSSEKEEKVFIIATDEEDVDSMAATFYQILAREELLAARARFYAHTLAGGNPAAAAGGKFVVEETLRRRLHVVASTRHKEDIETFDLVSPSGRRHQFPVVEKGIVHFQFPGLAEPGVWSYSLRTINPVDVIVTASAEEIQSSSADISSAVPAASAAVDVWTAGQLPTVIYARVRLGSLPVVNGSVTASIKGPGARGSTVLKLSDDGEEGGVGTPDLSPGDGIYSAYFTGGLEAGFYSLSVEATSDGAARVVADNGAVDIPTPSFTRYARAAFHVARDTEYLVDGDGLPAVDDIFPPARITNLRVDEYFTAVKVDKDGGSQKTSAGGVRLTWTAPGGDLNEGSAIGYELRCYTNRAALSQTNFSVTGIPVPEVEVPQPGPAGTRQTANITVPWVNEVFYYAIVAVDAAGNRGQVSNLVPVFVAETHAANGVNNADSAANAPLRAGPIFQYNDDNIIYIVSGSLTGLALIALCLGIAFICRTKRKEVMDKSDSLDYIKEFGGPQIVAPSTLLPATKYGYTSETGSYSAAAAAAAGNYSNVIRSGGRYASSGGSAGGPYSTSTGASYLPSEAETYSAEASAGVGNFCEEAGGRTHSPDLYSQQVGSYSPPRTSPSEYSTDSVFILGNSSSNNNNNIINKATMYTTYQNLPAAAHASAAARGLEQNSESELSETTSSGSRNFAVPPPSHWDNSLTTRINTCSDNGATWNNTWNGAAQPHHMAANHQLDAMSHSVSVTTDYREKKRRRKESFV